MKKYLFVSFVMVFLSISRFGFCEDLNEIDDVLFVYDDHGKRNPFWELIDGSGNIINYGGDIMVTDMFLEGIMLGSNGNNIAIINGNIAQKNDKIGDFNVFDIQTDTVILIKGDKRYELRLKKEE